MTDEKHLYHVVIEQTKHYPMRMIYDPKKQMFLKSESEFLGHARGFTKPYGWIKESGTPPDPHWDCILMSDGDYDLGDEVAVRIVGLFKRNDGDHKYVAVEASRAVGEIGELSGEEWDELHRFYPRVREGEGWFGAEEARFCMEHQTKAL